MPIIFEAIYEDRDPIVFSCLMLMIGVSIQDSASYKESVTVDHLVPFLCSGIEMELDPMASAPTNRHDMNMYSDLRDIVHLSGVIQKGQKVLTKSIALSALRFVISTGVSLQDVNTLSVVNDDPKFLGALVDVLIEGLAWIKELSSTPSISLLDVLDVDQIENCLGILERLALVSKRPAASLAKDTRLFPLLVQLITLCRAHAFQYPQRTDSMNLMLHALRLLINLTNGNEPCCAALAQSGSIHVLVQNFVQFYGYYRDHELEKSQADKEPTLKTSAGSQSDPELSLEMASQGSSKLENDEDDTRKCIQPGGAHESATADAHSSAFIKIDNDSSGWYDILLLSIGLLINMLETNSSRREQITITAIGLDCRAIGECFHQQCKCGKSFEALERLVEIYNTEAAISEMTENQVLAAYLALLIGSIVEGNPHSEARLCRTITGHSLEPMFELLQEFSTWHEAVLQVLKEQEGQSDTGPTVPDNSLCNISFKTSGTAETQKSFVKVIGVLQEIERRRYST
ncbi:hypothetical protein EDD11_009706 [Mortierella claussenii]|nr:hypothetical protein EDD11_009706 [Mortierella claussenii]